MLQENAYREEFDIMKRIKTFVSSILAGICIALGGTVYLLADNRVIGAFFFTLGLFTICTTQLDLFTGRVCYVFIRNAEYAIDLPVVWAGNLVGTWFSAKLLQCTRLAPALIQQAAAVSEAKLEDKLPSVFILAVFCNILIYVAVDGFRSNPHELGKYLAMFLGVMAFILCGFEHCVANMYFFTMGNAWSGTAWIYLLVITIGNAAGGILLPSIRAKLR